jgi:hypothetical protein
MSPIERLTDAQKAYAAEFRDRFQALLVARAAGYDDGA